jgi:hypothetical protein
MNRNLRKWLVLGGLLAFVGTAKADFNVQDKGTYYNNASTGLKTDASGNLATSDFDRDRDFPIVTPLFAAQTLTCKQSYQMPIAVPIMQYTRAAIMLTWSCAAVDSDSVRIAVRVYGATSSTSGNWYLWTPSVTYSLADTCAGPMTAGADSLTFGRCLKPVSFWVGRYANQQTETSPWIYGDHTSLISGASMTAGSRVRIRKVPSWAWRWASSNAVMLNLTDNSGAPCPFPYIRIEVANVTGASSGVVGASCSLTNVQADIWPRVQ